MRLPLWLDVKAGPNTSQVTVSLSRCRNCGKVKATSDPCGLDHLAALMELGRALRGETP